ncbi:hypothetical protein B0H11DRAFT_2043980 [Mycena galericulata]|nr:hypothetical protein B0H11DRAFT_2043980 [Mycena galericulata]
MFSRKTKRAAPFLPRDDLVNRSIYRIPGLQEKDFDPDVLLESPLTPPRKRTRGCTSKFIGWPAIVIIGQLLLQALGWGFFFVVKAHGQVPLPFRAAVWVKNNGHLVTLLSTMVATVLAGCSSFLFSYAIRRSMALYLYRPVSLATLGASVSISMRSVVFHRRSWKWPTVSLVFFFVAGVQTSGWSTLLTPVTIVVSTALMGSEIDLSSPILAQMYNQSVLDYCVSKDTVNTSIFIGESESGYAAARSSFKGQPSTFTLLDQVFNASTGGALPAYLDPVDASAWFTNKSVIPVTTHNASSAPLTGFSSNYTMLQQGFTANVSCSFQNLTNVTTPPLFQDTSYVTEWYEGYDINKALGVITWNEIKSPCDAPFGVNYTSSFTFSPRAFVMMIACVSMDGYTLIIVSDGAYSWIPTTVCSVAPKVTRLNVDYGSVINAAVDQNLPVVMDPLGPAGLSAISTLVKMVYFSQGIAGNVMGDHLTTLIEELDSREVANDVLNPMEKYIRGVWEYTGTVFRACLTANTTFKDGVPLNISIPTNGTLNTETLGWTYVSRATRWVLIPGTLIALATICIVSVALYLHAGDLPRDPDQFDPSNPLHLMAAAAAGGLNNAFRGLGTEDLKEGEKVDVVLGSIPGRGPALVRADQYSPVFANSFSPRSADDPASA